jgi:predicted transposase YbfD/YdcC
MVEPCQTGEDPRLARTKQPLLLAILRIAVCPLLTGGEGVQDRELFGTSTRQWRQPCLALPPGIPSHEPFGRVFARLHPTRFQECCLSWTRAVAALTQGPLVSLDGKTVRASFDRATAAAPGPRVSAWCAQNGGLVRGHLQTDSTSKELTARPARLHLLALTGCIVPMEALGCQPAIAGQIRAQEGDDLWALQSTPTKAYKAIKQHFHPHIEHQLAWRPAENFFAAFDDSHGRTIRRSVWVITALNPVPELAKWPELQSVMVVATMRAASPGAVLTSEYRIYISSLRRSATAFVTRMRQPWDSENKLQWALAVTFNEDRCRIRKDHAAKNMVALRPMTLHLLRQEHSHRLSLRQKRLLCGLDEHYLLTVLSRAT